MKKVTAYVNTVRVHWLVEELESAGISEIMVTEYFSPSSQISRMELLAKDDEVGRVRDIIHRVGTTGQPVDHSFFVEEYDAKLPSQIPLGKRRSKLEELRIKQLVHFLLQGSHKKIRAAFMFITFSILGVALFVYVQTKFVQKTAEESNNTVQLLYEATYTAQIALLEEMLAVERFHRGEETPALEDFRNARTKLSKAISYLRHAEITPQGAVTALADLEQRFHFLAESMSDIARSLRRTKETTNPGQNAQLYASHNLVMSSLDDLGSQMVASLASFEGDVNEILKEKQEGMRRSTQEVRISLLLLIVAAIAVTIAIWLIVERKVARPIQRLVAEAKTIDTMELK